ncbi:MAG: hypothetical protein JWM80_1398 [Cyanobacteria bacterium RYN_339]|nr:hypothetical protein [Cyanobacteria bacterium RYN_339]
MPATERFQALDELEHYELVPGLPDPRRFAVLGSHDFVLGRVRRLIVDLEKREVAYMVVNTSMSNFHDGKGEERLVPVGWAELLPGRRQAKLPHLTSLGFRRLPVYHPGGPIPATVDFPLPMPDEIEFWDIA